MPFINQSFVNSWCCYMFQFFFILNTIQVKFKTGGPSFWFYFKIFYRNIFFSCFSTYDERSYKLDFLFSVFDYIIFIFLMWFPCPPMCENQCNGTCVSVSYTHQFSHLLSWYESYTLVTVSVLWMRPQIKFRLRIPQYILQYII